MENKNTDRASELFDTGALIGEFAAALSELDMAAAVLALADTISEMKSAESREDAAILISGAIVRFVEKISEAANEDEDN